jgi:hypothetical protein
MINPDTLEALHRSRSVDLYHLTLVLDRLLSDPRRILEVRTQLHVGQAVRFVDHHSNTAELAMRSGRVVDLQDDALRQNWKLPYVAIEPGPANPGDRSDDPPPTPSPKPTRESFRAGDRVSFDDRHLQPRIGVITRVNAQTATIDCDGQRWRVSFQLLRHVRDV